MRTGLIVLLVGMAVALFFCVRRWDKGPLYRFLPPAYGLFAGVVLAIFWKTPSTTLTSTLETVAAFTVAGWVFWFSVWVEKRGR
jgi:hypothetical protein